MVNFFGLLKQEIHCGVVYYSYEELKSEIERYIKYCNEQRIKEKLGWKKSSTKQTISHGSIKIAQQKSICYAIKV